MNNFKINFKLQELDKIMPFGQAPNLSLHWFGLTDGLLWIEAGTHTIYEYSQAAQRYFDNAPRYNDYQISRFVEDFFDTFRYVGESIPEVLYHNLEIFDNKMSAWKELYEDKDDDIFDEFYFNEYHELRDWYGNRSFDSAHLIGGPYIGCFRCGDKLKIIWESSHELDDGNSIWTSPKGCVELTYEEFINGVEEFFKAFLVEMDSQVDNAILKDWKSIGLDKEMLAWENGQRKEGFLQQLSLLRNTEEKTDWDKVTELYLKMNLELEVDLC